MALLDQGTPAIQVEVRDSEVWLLAEGKSTQLTRDGKAKLEALLSPARDRVAYFEQCPESEGCRPEVVILDLAGRRIRNFPVRLGAAGANEDCASIVSIAWARERAIGAECHLNPSLDEYVEIDVTTGRTMRDLLGYDFTPSPGGESVAHVGWIPHFAPPPSQSNYLELDDTVIYPLPRGAKPFRPKGAEPPPSVVEERGLTFAGIHEFQPGMQWAPDSHHIALVDCVYDWTANGPEASSAGEGVESNRRCLVVVTSRSGEVVNSSAIATPEEEPGETKLNWLDPHTLRVGDGPEARILKVP